MIEDMKAALSEAKLSKYIAEGYPIEIGRYTYGGPRLHWSKGDFSYSLTIGAFCSIADGVGIFVGRHGRHSLDRVSTYPLAYALGARPSERVRSANAPKEDLSVAIGNDVWIGRDALIFAGVKIGDGAVIAARAVVNRDVAPYSVVAGVPAKKIRLRFDERICSKLLNLKWWNWPDELLKQRIDFFSDLNFEDQLDKYLQEELEIKVNEL